MRIGTNIRELDDKVNRVRTLVFNGSEATNLSLREHETNLGQQFSTGVTRRNKEDELLREVKAMWPSISVFLYNGEWQTSRNSKSEDDGEHASKID